MLPLIMMVLVFATAVFSPAALAAGATPAGSPVVTYTWAGSRMEGELWGVAQGDVDGNGTLETVLLERGRIRIGRVVDKGFDQLFSCYWGQGAVAARVGMVDLDGDGRDEVVISAVENQMPASMGLKIDLAANECRELFSRARWSVRVGEIPAEEGGLRKTLLGQGWSSQRFFDGSVKELALKGRTLTSVGKISLPRNSDLFSFAFFPAGDAQRVAIVKGWAPLEVHELQGGKWRRIWRSGERFGGSYNALEASQRPALDQESSDDAIFFTPPLVLAGPVVVGIHQEMPLRDMVGRHSYIRGTTLIAFQPDPALGYDETVRTKEMSGAVLDWIPHQGRVGGPILVLLQEATGAFESARMTTLFGFDVLQK